MPSFIGMDEILGLKWGESQRDINQNSRLYGCFCAVAENKIIPYIYIAKMEIGGRSICLGCTSVHKLIKGIHIIRTRSISLVANARVAALACAFFFYRFAKKR